MYLKLQQDQKEIQEVELGDVFHCEQFNGYFIVVRDWELRQYYLQKFNGVSYLFADKECNSLDSLRQAIVENSSLNFTHYPAKEYHLELVKNEIEKDGI